MRECLPAQLVRQLLQQVVQCAQGSGSRLAVVPHGSFSAGGWAEAVRRAARGVTEDVIGRTHGALDAAGALRRVPASDAATTFPAR